MNEWRQKIFVLLGDVMLIFGGFCLVQGQTRTIRVYNSRVHNNNRKVTSNRAAMKRVIKIR